MKPTPWTIRETQAHLSLPHIEVGIDLAHAGAGLSDLAISGAPQGNVSLLQVDAPNLTSGSSAYKPIDTYVRQNDLVATYEESQGHRRRLQAYWRAIESTPELTAATILELVVSVQTDLLDSQPAMCVASQFPTGEYLQFADTGENEPVQIDHPLGDSHAGLLLVRPAGSDVSFMQATHPADCSDIQISTQDADASLLEVRHPLFAEQLEKGVIRRSRVRVAILPRSGDLALAFASFREFAASEPMLTV
jgi:hypothetical protein